MRRVCLCSLLSLSGVWVAACANPPATLPVAEPIAANEESAAPDPSVQLEAFARAVDTAMRREALDLGQLPLQLREPAAPVYVGFFADQGLLSFASRTPNQVEGPLAWHTLEAAIHAGLDELGPERAASVRNLSVEFADEFIYYDALDASQWRQFLNLDRHDYANNFGLLGDAVGIEEFSSVRPPSEAIASNLKFEAHYQSLREDWRLNLGQVRSATFASFSTESFLVTLDPLAATAITRGNVLVEPEQVTAEAVLELATRAAGWMQTNIDEQGALTYGYYPSVGQPDRRNNAIRQWNASHALLRWAEARGDKSLRARVTRNIEHNLGWSFHFEQAFGVVEHNGKSKLGALALAGIALHRHDRDRWAQQIAGLRATIDELFQPEGHFRSFYRGSTKEYWNFYPGEALLFWAELYAAKPDPELLRKYVLAFDFHRSWHLDSSDPRAAFVPWHLLANGQILTSLAGSEPALEGRLREFCFELADELLALQQWEGETAEPDEWGRFYAPEGQEGAATASSTGIYTWALVTAFVLARDAGQSERAERYRLSILRGLRNLMQLQFVDEIDMYYVGLDSRAQVAGALRTNVTDNRIRVDNVHYALLAASAVLEHFGPEDFAL